MPRNTGRPKGLRVVERAGALYIVGTVTPAGEKVGRRYRFRAGTDEPRLAEEEARTFEARILRTAWHGERRGSRSFAEAAESYLRTQQRSASTLKFVRNLTLHFGTTALADIAQDAVNKAKAALLRPNPAPATVKRNLIVPLLAILNHAADQGWCDPPRIKAPTVVSAEGRAFIPAEFQQAYAAAGHLQPFMLVAVCTGLRVREMLALRRRMVDLQAGCLRLPPEITKNRTGAVVRLPPAAQAALAQLLAKPARKSKSIPTRRRKALASTDYQEATTPPPTGEDPVFLTHLGRAYSERDGGGHIKTAWAAMLRRAGLSGFTPHDMRRTFATWHWAIHRDLLRLVRDGRWKSIDMVRRYERGDMEGHEEGIRRVWGMAQAEQRKDQAA